MLGGARIDGVTVGAFVVAIVSTAVGFHVEIAVVVVVAAHRLGFAVHVFAIAVPVAVVVEVVVADLGASAAVRVEAVVQAVGVVVDLVCAHLHAFGLGRVGEVLAGVTRVGRAAGVVGVVALNDQVVGFVFIAFKSHFFQCCAGVDRPIQAVGVSLARAVGQERVDVAVIGLHGDLHRGADLAGDLPDLFDIVVVVLHQAALVVAVHRRVGWADGSGLLNVADQLAVDVRGAAAREGSLRDQGSAQAKVSEPPQDLNIHRPLPSRV